MTGEAMRRFSLKILFAVSTLAIVFLGYSQWRRRLILRQTDEIRMLGGLVDLPNGYFDCLWQRIPESAVIRVSLTQDREEAARDGWREAEIADKMRTMGIKYPVPVAPVGPSMPVQ
jgi:hypothetical protein